MEIITLISIGVYLTSWERLWLDVLCPLLTCPPVLATDGQLGNIKLDQDGTVFQTKVQRRSITADGCLQKGLKSCDSCLIDAEGYGGTGPKQYLLGRYRITTRNNKSVKQLIPEF